MLWNVAYYSSVLVLPNEQKNNIIRRKKQAFRINKPWRFNRYRDAVYNNKVNTKNINFYQIRSKLPKYRYYHILSQNGRVTRKRVLFTLFFNLHDYNNYYSRSRDNRAISNRVFQNYHLHSWYHYYISILRNKRLGYLDNYYRNFKESMTFVRYVKYLSTSAYKYDTTDFVGNTLYSKYFYGSYIDPFFFFNRYYYKRNYTNYLDFIKTFKSIKASGNLERKLDMCDAYVGENISYANDYVQSLYDNYNALLDSNYSDLSTYYSDINFASKRRSRFKYKYRRGGKSAYSLGYPFNKKKVRYSSKYRFPRITYMASFMKRMNIFHEILSIERINKKNATRSSVFLIYFHYYFNSFFNIKCNKKYTYNILRRMSRSYDSAFVGAKLKFFRMLFLNRFIFRKYKRVRLFNRIQKKAVLLQKNKRLYGYYSFYTHKINSFYNSSILWKYFIKRYSNEKHSHMLYGKQRMKYLTYSKVYNTLFVNNYKSFFFNKLHVSTKKMYSYNFHYFRYKNNTSLYDSFFKNELDYLCFFRSILNDHIIKKNSYLDVVSLFTFSSEHTNTWLLNKNHERFFNKKYLTTRINNHLNTYFNKSLAVYGSYNNIGYFLPNLYRINVLNDLSCFTYFRISDSTHLIYSFSSLLMLKYNIFLVNSDIFYFFITFLVCEKSYYSYSKYFSNNIKSKFKHVRSNVIFIRRWVLSRLSIYSYIIVDSLYQMKSFCKKNLLKFSYDLSNSTKFSHVGTRFRSYLNKYKLFFRKSFFKLKLKKYLQYFFRIHLKNKKTRHAFYNKLIKFLEKRNPMFNSFYNDVMLNKYFSVYKKKIKTLFSVILKRVCRKSSKKLKRALFKKNKFKKKMLLKSYCNNLVKRYIDSTKTFSNYFSYFKGIHSKVKKKSYSLNSVMNTYKVRTSFIVHLVRSLYKIRNQKRSSFYLGKITDFYSALKVIQFRNNFISSFNNPGVTKTKNVGRNIVSYMKHIKGYNFISHGSQNHSTLGSLLNIFLTFVFTLKDYLLLPTVSNYFTTYKRNILFFGYSDFSLSKRTSFYAESNVTDIFDVKIEHLFK